MAVPSIVTLREKMTADLIDNTPTNGLVTLSPGNRKTPAIVTSKNPG